MQMLLPLFLFLCVTIAVAMECPVVAAKPEAGEFLKYFNPMPQKAYLNEKQDRLIKRKVFKVNDMPDVQPVPNNEVGIFVELNQNEANDAPHVEKIIARPDIQGCSVLLTWRQLEPEEGAYNWQPVDNLIGLMRKHGKKLILRISTAGVEADGCCDTPQWVLDSGAKSIQYQCPDGTQRTMPIFWDTTYLATWSNFVKAFGKRFDGNPVFHSVGITGGGMGGGTAVVPESASVANQPAAGTKEKTLLPELTQRLTQEFGMNQKQLIDHWKYVADLFPQSFPTTRLNFDIDPTTPNRAGQNALDDISDYLVYRYGQRIFLTRQNVNDGKHGFEQYRVIIKLRPDTYTGYQLTSKVTPEDMQKISRTALDDGVSFLEIPEALVQSENELVKKALHHLSAHLGYQLLMKKAAIPSQVRSASPMSASFEFINLGDAIPAAAERNFDKDISNSYKVQMEFRNASGKLMAVVMHTPEIPTTGWASGKPIAWEELLKMPALAPGKYAVSMSLVDPATKQRLNILDGLGQNTAVIANTISLGTLEVD